MCKEKQEGRKARRDCITGLASVEGEREGRKGGWDDSQTATLFQEMFSQGALASYVLLERRLSSDPSMLSHWLEATLWKCGGSQWAVAVATS